MRPRLPSLPAARTQLRMRVLAGVVAVTLVALAAFDLVAVTTMRHYLYGQTRDQLGTAAEQAHQELSSLSSAAAGTGRPGPGVSQFASGIVGQLDIIWLPTGGKPRAIQLGSYTIDGSSGVPGRSVTDGIARTATKEGYYTVSIGGQQTLLRAIGYSAPDGIVVAGTALAQVTSTVARIELIIVTGSAAVILLIGAGVFLVLRLGLRPIEAMAAQADQITAGDLEGRVASHNARSEIGRLGSALNGMLTRIEATVREREASQEQMRRFFADASHELRTPLASLLANAELHQHGVLTEPAQITEVMRRVAHETQRMGRLVDDMLRLARLGQRRELLDLTALVADCAERARVADPGRRWQVAVADGLQVRGDEELLRRAVDNLCANVLVHTPRDTAGTIAAAASQGRIRIEVSDDGPGVAADKLPRIFERFYRAGTGASRPGSGLGLAIVAEVAAAHDGTAEAVPASPHGLRMTLTLPVDQQTLPVPPTATVIAGSA